MNKRFILDGVRGFIMRNKADIQYSVPPISDTSTNRLSHHRKSKQNANVSPCVQISILISSMMLSEV
jgi:hypothetical protein